jgi:uncharacterized membrane protein
LSKPDNPEVISFVRTKGWGTALSIVFSFVAATATVFVFLYLNVPTMTLVNEVNSRVTRVKEYNEKTLIDQKTDLDQKLVELKEEQKEMKAENIRLRTEVRDELRELRRLLLDSVSRKKYSHFNRFNGNSGAPLFKEAKATGF